jgi:hypothetical protein
VYLTLHVKKYLRIKRRGNIPLIYEILQLSDEMAKAEVVFTAFCLWGLVVVEIILYRAFATVYSSSNCAWNHSFVSNHMLFLLSLRLQMLGFDNYTNLSLASR